MNILLVTPLPKEAAFLRQALTFSGYQLKERLIGRLPAAQLPELKLTLACGGAGKAQFALQTQHLIDHGDAGWNLVICAGAAGALLETLAVGDVVLGTVTVEHDYNNKFSTYPLPNFEGSRSAITGLKNSRPSNASFQVHLGPIASGDEDVIDGERRSALQEATGALAVAWEGAGGARACAFSDVPFLEIRGITDSADHQAPADFKRNLEKAMSNVAVLIRCWLESQR